MPPSSDDKPFDKEPFDAGIEADEDSDPKKFIEQLTGKLGQSLRKYTEAQGQPDFELEKFAVNSLLAATHTSEMDANDQNDIIKKVKSAGNKDDDNSDSELDTEVNANTDSAEQPDLDTDGAAADAGSNGEFSGEVNESEEGLFSIEPKKNNMFQPHSNDILENGLNESEKSSIFGKIKSRLRETFNQEDDMNQPMIEPQVAPQPTVKPNPSKVEPNIAPSRKNKPFLPMPNVKPNPKASK